MARKGAQRRSGTVVRSQLLASAYGLKGETEHAAAELAEARRLRSDDRLSSIASVKAFPGGYLGLAPNIRASKTLTILAVGHLTPRPSSMPRT